MKNWILTVFYISTLHWTCNSINAQTNNHGIIWSNPIQISNDSVPSISPQIIAVDDTIHILWYGNDTLGTISNDGIQYSHSFDGGKTFSNPITLLSADNAFSPGLFTNVNGQLKIVLFTFIDQNLGTWIINGYRNGIEWDNPKLLRTDVYPLFITSKDNIVLMHFYSFINYKDSLLISEDHGITWSAYTSPSFSNITLSQSGLYAIGTTKFDSRDEVAFYYSSNNDHTWSFPEIVSHNDAASSHSPNITANESEYIYCVWIDTGRTMFRRGKMSDRRIIDWQPEIALSDTNGAVLSDISSNDNFVVVVWDNDLVDGGGIRMRYSNNNARTFFPLEFPSVDNTARAPKILLSDNSLHLVWSENGEIFYRQAELLIPTPEAYYLKQNYPNPFSHSTLIELELPVPSDVKLTVYNILGQKIRTIEKYLQAGQQTITLERLNYPSGMYFYKLQTNQFTETKKMIILR